MRSHLHPETFEPQVHHVLDKVVILHQPRALRLLLARDEADVPRQYQVFDMLRYHVIDLAVSLVSIRENKQRHDFASLRSGGSILEEHPYCSYCGTDLGYRIHINNRVARDAEKTRNWHPQLIFQECESDIQIDATVTQNGMISIGAG